MHTVSEPINAGTTLFDDETLKRIGFGKECHCFSPLAYRVWGLHLKSSVNFACFLHFFCKWKWSNLNG